MSNPTCYSGFAEQSFVMEVFFTEYIVGAEYNGVLLRTYLKNGLFLSRSLVSAMKREQGLKVNGENVTVRYVLKTGDIVSVSFEDKGKGNVTYKVKINEEKTSDYTWEFK